MAISSQCIAVQVDNRKFQAKDICVTYNRCSNSRNYVYNEHSLLFPSYVSRMHLAPAGMLNTISF